MRLRGVPEFGDERVAVKRLLNDPPLDALAPTVDQSHLFQPVPVGLGDVLLDHRPHVFGRKRVQIDMRFDGKSLGGQGAA